MSVILKDVTRENWRECVGLTTHPEGKLFVYEEFVGSNALSLAQSKVEEGWITKTLYDEQAMIGFTMYGLCPGHNFYKICRLMIDYRHQGKGYGKLALKKVIEEMKNLEGCNKIYLSVDPKNEIGKKMYQNFNFKDTGKMVAGELIYCLTLN